MQTLTDLTLEQAREAPAGTKTDALVAEALGLDVRRIGNLALVWSNHYGCLVPPDRYTTERDAAGEATDWLIPLTSGRIIIEHDNNEPAEYLWAVSYRPGGARTSVHAPAEPLARCRAVLLAAVIRREQKK